jgi:hypothetical protein
MPAKKRPSPVGGYVPPGQKRLQVTRASASGHVVLPTIIAAAILQGGKIYFCEAPCRHHHVIWAKCQLDGKGFDSSQVQGFLTNDGRFLDRHEARVAVVATGQCPHPMHRSELFSEDLW